MRRALPLFGLLALSGFSLQTATVAAAQVAPVPQLMNFQGRLTRPDGTPVADGSYSIRFSLWTLAVNGLEKWSQTFTQVAVRSGVFSVPLGTATGAQGGQAASGPLNATVFYDDLYLEIKVESSPPLSPRQRLATLAYAYKAEIARSVPDGAIGAGQLANGAVTLDKLAPGVRAQINGGAGGDLTGFFPDPQLATLAGSLYKVSGTLMSATLANQDYLDVSQTTAPFRLPDTAWQSWTAGQTGSLTGIDLLIGTTTGASRTMPILIYAGEGTGGTLLGQYSATFITAFSYQRVQITPPIPVVSGQKYTWATQSVSSSLEFGYATGNPYAGGRAGAGDTMDHAFKTYVTVPGGSSVSVRANLNVQEAIRMDAANKPIIVRQGNLFTSGANEGVGRWGLFQEPNTLFLGIPATDVANGSLRLGTWTSDGLRTDLMTLLNSGNVGIGTNTPTQRLDVAGNASVSGTVTAASATIPTFSGNVNFAGNVGIGVPTPTSPLAFANSTGPKINLANGAGFGTQAGLLQMYTAASGDDIVFGFGTSAALTERLRIKGTGNVGLGTNAPTQALDVNGLMRLRGGNPQAGNVLAATDNLGTIGWRNPSDALGAASGDLTGTYPAPTIAANAVSTAKVADSAVTTPKIADNAVTTAKVADNAVTSAKLAFATASLARVSGGAMVSTGTQVGMGLNVPFVDARLSIVNLDNAHGLRIAATGSTWGVLFQNNSNTRLNTAGIGLAPDGQLYLTNTVAPYTAAAILRDNGTWGTFSDRRLKTDIEPLTNLLDKAIRLDPVQYFLKSQNRETSQEKEIGFIAQDVEAVFPSLVQEASLNGKSYKTLNYAGLGVIAIGALKELSARVEAQQKQIEVLKAQAQTAEGTRRENAELRALLSDLSRRLEALERAGRKQDVGRQ